MPLHPGMNCVAVSSSRGGTQKTSNNSTCRRIWLLTVLYGYGILFLHLYRCKQELEVSFVEIGLEECLVFLRIIIDWWYSTDGKEREMKNKLKMNCIAWAYLAAIAVMLLSLCADFLLTNAYAKSTSVVFRFLRDVGALFFNNAVPFSAFFCLLFVSSIFSLRFCRKTIRIMRIISPLLLCSVFAWFLPIGSTIRCT